MSFGLDGENIEYIYIIESYEKFQYNFMKFVRKYIYNFFKKRSYGFVSYTYILYLYTSTYFNYFSI